MKIAATVLLSVLLLLLTKKSTTTTTTEMPQVEDHDTELPIISRSELLNEPDMSEDALFPPIDVYDPDQCPIEEQHMDILLPNYDDCATYYQCVHGYRVLRSCGEGTHFNAVKKICDWPHRANCRRQTVAVAV